MTELLARFGAANAPTVYKDVKDAPCGGAATCGGCDDCAALTAFVRNQQRVWEELATFDEVRDAMLLFLRGEIQCSFTHMAPLAAETTRDPEFHRALVNLTRGRFVAVGSQPQQTPEPPHLIRQRAYVEFIAHRDHEAALTEFCHDHGYVLFVENRVARNPAVNEVHRIGGVWRISVTEQGPRRGTFTSCPAMTSHDWGYPENLPAWHANPEYPDYAHFCLIDPDWEGRDLLSRLAAEFGANSDSESAANSDPESVANSDSEVVPSPHACAQLPFARAAKTLERVLELGSEIRVEDFPGFPAPEDGLTVAVYHTVCLQRAALEGNSPLVEHLLTWDRSEAEPEASESFALHFAIMGGHFECVRCLVEDGRADANVAYDAYIGCSDEGVRLSTPELFERVVRVFMYLYEADALQFDAHCRCLRYIAGETQHHEYQPFCVFEAMAVAALRTGLWQLDGPDFEARRDNAWSDDYNVVSLPGRAVLLALEGLTPLLLRDRRTDPVEAAHEWMAGGAWWSSIGNVAVQIARFQILKDMLAVDAERGNTAYRDALASQRCVIDSDILILRRAGLRP